LDEAVQELKENEFRALFEKDLAETAEKLKIDCQIETDLRVLIPEKYISSISERLSLYTQLDDMKTEEELVKFESMIIDRFGPIPPEMSDMIEIVRVRWIAESLGMEKILLKNNNLKCFFVPSENEKYYKSAVFGKVIEYVKQNSRKCSLKEVKGKLMLYFDKITSIEELKWILKEMSKI
jgi:transcription-repair coupling factor (superfamily II helicase)